MDEQTDREFQLERARARQKALKESISQELALFKQQADEDQEKHEEADHEDLRKKIVDTRVLIEDARQRIGYNMRRLSQEFQFDWNPKDIITEHPRGALMIALAAGFYFGLKK